MEWTGLDNGSPPPLDSNVAGRRTSKILNFRLISSSGMLIAKFPIYIHTPIHTLFLCGLVNSRFLCHCEVIFSQENIMYDDSNEDTTVTFNFAAFPKWFTEERNRTLPKLYNYNYDVRIAKWPAPPDLSQCIWMYSPARCTNWERIPSADDFVFNNWNTIYSVDRSIDRSCEFITFLRPVLILKLIDRSRCWVSLAFIWWRFLRNGFQHISSDRSSAPKIMICLVYRYY